MNAVLEEVRKNRDDEAVEEEVLWRCKLAGGMMVGIAGNFCVL